MAEKINYDYKRIGTNDAEITFGEIDKYNITSGVTMRVGTSSPDGIPHYFRMDKDGDAKEKGRRGTIFECPGSFQVKAGHSVKRGIPGVYIDSQNGDLVLKSSGRIRIIAENIDLIATGVPSEEGENGVININASEKIIIDSKGSVVVKSTVSTYIFSEKTTEIVGNAVLNIYGGLVEGVSGSTTLKGSQSLCGANPLGTPDEILKAIKLLALGG
jgi:hypothetical protein